MITGIGLLVSQSATAQGERVIHLWVDPRYGNDSLAGGPASVNPNGSNTAFLWGAGIGGGLTCRNTQGRPHDVVDTNRVLLHAPYPFRTIKSAVQYIIAATAPGSVTPLPNTSSTGYTWEHAIIHLLPGMYATLDNPNFQANGSKKFHLDNGLAPNGETFPIYLPPNVSIQGTNSLNTFFDLAGAVAFKFGVYFDPSTWLEYGHVAPGGTTTVPSNGANCFISSVTFFGGGAPNDTPSGGKNPGTEMAAIVIDEYVASSPTIVNCMFLKNRIGMVVNSGSSTTHHGTTIVNNTFAWNNLGLWNGQNANQSNLQNVNSGAGLARLNVLNNIFDTQRPGPTVGAVPLLPCDEFTGSPNVWWPAHPHAWPAGQNQLNASAFEGIAAEDMSAVIGGTPIDFNAYERHVAPNGSVSEPYNRSTVNTGAFFGLNIPHTAVRIGGTNPRPVEATTSTRGRNISRFTGYNSLNDTLASGVRGSLYVRDLFCRGMKVTNSSLAVIGQHTAFPSRDSGFDGSPHDFRICPTPAVATYLSTQTGLPLPDPSLPSPLIDNGFGFWLSSTPVAATMGNSQTVGRPGYLSLGAAQSRWHYFPLQHDCEGFGNPRVFDDLSVNNEGVGAPIDIGADECADLIIAGYRFGTTSFIGLNSSHEANVADDNHSSSMRAENTNLWYLGHANTQLSSSGFSNQQPSMRVYNFALFGLGVVSSYPRINYASPIEMPWHSTEYSSPQLMAWVRPWRFDPLGSGLTPRVTGAFAHDLYHATPADTTPHLLPDLHPWWSQVSPVAGLHPYELPTGNPMWQNCLVSGYKNELLFENLPALTSSLINPAGTGMGFASATNSFAWLDGTIQPLVATPTFEVFGKWQTAPGPFALDNYDSWCRGGQGTAVHPQRTLNGQPYNRLYEFPATQEGSVPEPIAIRFSLEWDGGGATSLSKNLQSFMVINQTQGQ